MIDRKIANGFEKGFLKGFLCSAGNFAVSASEEIVNYEWIIYTKSAVNVVTNLPKWVSVLDRHINVCSWRLRIRLTRHLPNLLEYKQHEVKTCSYENSWLNVWLWFYQSWQGSQYRNKMLQVMGRIGSVFLMAGQTGVWQNCADIGVGGDLCSSLQ